MEPRTESTPTEEQWADMLFAWKVCRHVRSNAIVIARDGATVGIGAGQMSRVDSVRLAIEKARDARGDEAEGLLQGSALASDAFFPFADGPQAAVEAGVTSVIQPGGSKRDDEVVAAADAAGVAMVFTGPPALPPLAMGAREHPGLTVVRVFCAADGSGGNPLGVFLDGGAMPRTSASRSPTS